MKVNVFDGDTFEAIDTKRYLDEVIEHYSALELSDLEYSHIQQELQDVGRYWLSPEIYIKIIR